MSGLFCNGNEPKSGLVRDLGDRLQSRNVPFGTSGDLRNTPGKRPPCLYERASGSLQKNFSKLYIFNIDSQHMCCYTVLVR